MAIPDMQPDEKLAEAERQGLTLAPGTRVQFERQGFGSGPYKGEGTIAARMAPNRHGWWPPPGRGHYEVRCYRPPNCAGKGGGDVLRIVYPENIIEVHATRQPGPTGQGGTR